MLLSSLLLLLLPLVAAVGPKPRKTGCLQSGDEKPINAALKKGGKGAVVTLCQGSTHRLNSSIVFTTPRQTLTTEGNPKGRERAMLIVEGQDVAVAVRADCRECSFATVSSLIVDGNRPILLRIPKGEGLLEMGNSESQTVRDCRLYEPRGWTALHFREGDLKQCRKAHIVDNDIGPCGEEWDDEYDGVTEAEPVNGNPRADGISLACQDSLVERNIVTDATDGAIVLFGSAGSEVRNNHVYSRSRTNLGGINLVDYEPWKGDYFGTTVHHNTIHALAGFLRVGIVVGPASWSDDTETLVHSGSVTDNILEGTRFGYGLVVSSADTFTVLRNKVDDNAVFSGVPGSRCPKAPENAPPAAFLINRGSATGTFQSEFVNGEVQHIICINPPDENGVPYKPWRLRESPEAIAKRLEGETPPDGPISFDSRLAEAVVSYQMKLLGAMNGINDRIERHNRPLDEDEEGGEGTGKGGKSRTGVKEVDSLDRKLELLEKGEKGLQKEMEAIQREMLEMTHKVKKFAEEDRPILMDVFKNIAILQSPALGDTPPPQPPKPPHTEEESEESASDQPATELLGQAALFAGAGIIVLAAVAMIRRYRSYSLGSSNSSKKGKLI